ncbi:hypothetical protein D9757_002454 [Collybiopsis confluens]|uniref:BZIP domain-containing protein n=1 Tax=Collybiopsis confluens TaxID=2823264 RepID=A0A8H5HYH9_9AGAR|nr:hypothetical protein D9757_002454 [Collybiopsis confluens]
MESLPKIYRWEHSPSILLSSSNPQPGSPICDSENESELTHDGHRRFRLPPLNLRLATQPISESNLFAISVQPPYTRNPSQDGPSLVNNSTDSPNDSTTSHTGLGTLDVLQPPSPLNSLAAHYGIPQSLPRPPRIASRPVIESNEMLPDFESLSRNYISMLASKPLDNTSAAPEINMSVTNDQEMPPPAAPQVEDQAATLQAAIDTMLGTPSPLLSHFPRIRSLRRFSLLPFNTPYNDFSASPMDDSPFINTPYNDFTTSPMDAPIMDIIDGEFGWMSGGTNESLFNHTTSALYSDLLEPTKEAAPVTTAAEILHKNENLLTPSPATPMLDFPNNLYSVPLCIFPIATGTRRNITPDNLVPLDAPTQSRRYLAPSVTSRKDAPTLVAKKRSRSSAFGDNEPDEEVLGEAPGPHATDHEKIEYKRRMSTIAARKSRRRKLEHKLMLETRVDELEKETEKWKTRCRVLQEVLRSKSVDFRFEDDE